MKRSSLSARDSVSALECRWRERERAIDAPSVFIKSTLLLPPAASHLKQRERLSTNCLSQPHCLRRASNCSTQKTVQRAEMSPSSTSASGCGSADGQIAKRREAGRTAELEGALRRSAENFLDRLRDIAVVLGRERRDLVRQLVTVPRDTEPFADARQVRVLECLVVALGAAQGRARAVGDSPVARTRQQKRT